MHRTAICVGLTRPMAGCGLVAPWKFPSQTSAHTNFIATRMNIHNQAEDTKKSPTQKTEEEKFKPAKTIAQLDKDLEEKLAGLAGDGGSAGVEYEDGKPAAMKRSVKNNMFRYI